MVSCANRAKKDLELRRTVELICAHIEPGDYSSEILAVYNWVWHNIRYMRDIYDVEFLKDPVHTIRTKSGDCDDIATLLASMLMSCGNKVQFCVVGMNGKDWSHVFCQVLAGDQWVTVDPVAGVFTQKMHGTITKIAAIPV